VVVEIILLFTSR